MSIMVLLGAGASFGSVDVTPEPPPLGTGLFERLVTQGGIASTIPQEIKDVFLDDFEAGMDIFYKKYHGNTMQFQRELAYLLASYSPGENNIYSKLITVLPRKKTIFSSLNYDLLFEISAYNMGLKTLYSNDFYKKYKEKSVRLLKIHGSSNFWPRMAGMSIHNCKFFGMSGSDIESEIDTLMQNETLRRCKIDDSLAPAMSHFMVGKKVKVSPKMVDQQYQMWKDSVLKSKKIFVIGVRVHEVDKHIWDVLGDSKAWVGYFGFRSDEDAFLKWKDNHKKNNCTFFESDFKNAISIIKRHRK